MARKKRTRFWREQVPLAYAVLVGSFVLIYLAVAFTNRRLPGWLAAFGVSPSGVHLLLGTLSCAVGIWGIRVREGKGAGWAALYVLCLLGGVLTLARVFAFI